jgi:hypothetical protein
MSFNFVPPGNPLDYYADHPFRPVWRRRTPTGRVCYFCGTLPDPDDECPVPCCEAAYYWNAECRQRAVRHIWNVIHREVRG